MTVILFLVQQYQKIVSDFSKATFVSTTHKKGHSCGKQIDSQLLERSGKSSIQIFQSMLHHWNIFQLMKHYTQWDTKLPSNSIISISHIVMVSFWSHWMMQDLTIHAKLYVCCKTEGWRWFLLLEVYIIYMKCLVTEMAADQPLTGRTISNGYLCTSIDFNKLASRSRHCNSRDIAEREKWNTIWTFRPTKQSDF